MRPGNRIAISLLITILLFTVFVFLAFSGLFSYIERTFYNNRVSANIQSDLTQKAAAIQEFHENQIDRFVEIFSDPLFWQVYRNNVSRELIEKTTDTDRILKREISGYLGYRFIDEDGKIWYSSFQGDIRESTATRRVYYQFADVEPENSLDDYIVRDDPSFRIESRGQRFAYLIPVRNTIDEYQGTLIVYTGYSGLMNNLSGRSLLEAGRSSALIGKETYLFNAGIIENDEILEDLGRQISSFEKNTGQLIIGGDSTGLYNLYIRTTERYGKLAYVASAEEVSLTGPLKVLLLTMVFLTIFLISFLILSIRQDDMAVISERIKRFQYSFLKEYLKKSGKINLQRWSADLQSQQEIIKKKLLKGIRKSQYEEAEKVFDQNWHTIIELLSPEVRSSQPSLDIKNLEVILEKVLEKQRSLETSMSAGSGQDLKKISPKPRKVPEKLEEAEA